MKLADVHGELLFELHSSLQALTASQQPMSTFGDMFDDVCAQLEALAICHLMEFADTKEFHINLTRSGQARRYFLWRSQREGNTRDRHLALGRTTSVMAAFAAGQLSLARDIAQLSPTQWERDWEYEDDHGYFLLLHRVALDPTSFHSQPTEQILNNIERVVDGKSWPQLDACWALYRRDAAEFEAALERLLEAENERNEWERTADAVTEGDAVYWARRCVSVEGLALLNIARLLQVPPRRSFPLCHPLAQLPLGDRPIANFFEDIEAKRFP